MSDTAPAVAASTKPRKQGRSPAYPGISLKDALTKAGALYKQEGKYPAPMSSAFAAWGFGIKSSGGRETRAALRYFGLITIEGDNETGKVKLTDDALRVLLDEREDQTEKRAIIRRLALNPPIHDKLFKQYPDGIKSDASVAHALVFEDGYNKGAADELVAEFKETADYAALFQPAKIAVKEVIDHEIAIGDFVRVEIDGVIEMERTQVRDIMEDQGIRWFFVKGSETGLTGDQVTFLQRGAAGDVKPPVTPPRLPEDKAPAILPPQLETRREVFTLDEGDVVLTYPAAMSAASFHDLDEYLGLFLRKAQRRAGAGDFFGEVYAPDGIKAKEVRYFDDFAATMKFVEAFKERATADILRVHLPSRATDEERQKIRETGAQSV